MLLLRNAQSCDSLMLRDAYKIFGKKITKTECEAHWHIACSNEIFLSSDFDRVAVLKLNFGGGLAAERASSSQWKVYPFIVSSNRSKSSLASLHPTFSSNACMKMAMWMLPAKCSTKCTATRIAVNFWYNFFCKFWFNFCYVIFFCNFLY